jgi:hypothetical protein
MLVEFPGLLALDHIGDREGAHLCKTCEKVCEVKECHGKHFSRAVTLIGRVISSERKGAERLTRVERSRWRLRNNADSGSSTQELSLGPRQRHRAYPRRFTRAHKHGPCRVGRTPRIGMAEEAASGALHSHSVAKRSFVVSRDDIHKCSGHQRLLLYNNIVDEYYTI